MRILSALALALALALIIGCGASGPTETVDAAGDASVVSDASDAATCARGFVRVEGSRCASYSDTNCDGMQCRSGTYCSIESISERVFLACVAP